MPLFLAIVAGLLAGAGLMQYHCDGKSVAAIAWLIAAVFAAIGAWEVYSRVMAGIVRFYSGPPSHTS
jgi:hypothetical protein